MVTDSTIWRQSSSGLIVPIGYSNLSKSKSTFFQVKEMALELEGLYSSNSVKIPKTSDLACIIGRTKQLSDDWFLDNKRGLTLEALYNMFHLQRVASAVLPFRNDPKLPRYLRSFLNGHLNFLRHGYSYAKSMLWDLEVASMAKKVHVNADLSEPDVMTTLPSGRLAIACKKLFSEKHVQNVLSEAVAQIESSGETGIVAVNIDDLLPENQLFLAQSVEAVRSELGKFAEDFLRRHEHTFRRYLSCGRLVSAGVCVNAIVGTGRKQNDYSSGREWFFWTIPGLEFRKEALIDEFAAGFRNRQMV